MGPEAKLEKKLVEAVGNRIGLCIKMTGQTGLPDRMCILPGGKVFFVEMKSDTGRLSPIQEKVISDLRWHGIQVYVLRGAYETEAFITRLATGWDPT